MISGGITQTNERLSRCFTFSINSLQECLEKASMCEARNDHGLIYFQGYLYAFGGGTGRDPLNSAEMYDIENDSWKVLPNMPVVGKLMTCISW